VNVLIIGENRCNSYIDEYLAERGFSVKTLSDIYALRSISGEVGNFHVKLNITDSGCNVSLSDIRADIVVLTEQPTAKTAPISGLQTTPITQGDVLLPPVSEPVIFLLDYIGESPMSATFYALQHAAMLARNKRQVYYLSKFIRTAGHGVDELYKKAREAGVVFVKYNNLSLRSSDDMFTITVSGGGQTLDFNTKTVHVDGGFEVGERFSHVVKKLTLTSNKLGYVTEDMYFLTPVLTSRRGVYHLTRDVIAERIDEGLEFICTHAIAETDVTASIDGDKCAFCYNCYRACSHAALAPDTASNQMQALQSACYGCGVCTSLCPAKAITLTANKMGNQHSPTLSTPLNSSATTNKPTQSAAFTSSPPSLFVLCCENTGAAVTVESLDGIECIVVPCGGSIEMEQLSSGLLHCDRVVSIVCSDDACRHFNGNKRACLQTQRLQKTLEAAGLDSGKVSVIKASSAMKKILLEEIKTLMQP